MVFTPVLTETVVVPAGSFASTPDGHCQVDIERAGSAAGEATTQPSELDTRHLEPNAEGARAQQAMVGGPIRDGGSRYAGARGCVSIDIGPRRSQGHHEIF